MKKYVNRKARFSYFFMEELVTGIVLTGTEIKSIRAGQVSFTDSFARIKNTELWLIGLHIAPYKQGGHFNHEAERPRKLLAHKREITKLKRKLDEQGLTLVPKEIFINQAGLAKLVLALAKGKKLYDKRDTIKGQDINRDTQRQLKSGRYER